MALINEVTQEVYEHINSKYAEFLAARNPKRYSLGEPVAEKPKRAAKEVAPKHVEVEVEVEEVKPTDEVEKKATPAKPKSRRGRPQRKQN